MRLEAFDPLGYQTQLEQKYQQLKNQFAGLGVPPIEVFASPVAHFRMRAEFRIWHDGDDSYYAMFDSHHPQQPIRVNEFPIATKAITERMQPLLNAIQVEPALRRKLFQVEFLATLTGQVLVTLIYHRRLDESWQIAAKQLEQTLQIAIIGRSRGQRIVMSQDFVDECLTVLNRSWFYRQPENAFTQPNATVCHAMLDWTCAQAATIGAGDLLELYCGIGTFTFPLSRFFNRVLATEMSRTAIAAAQHNQQVNQVDNVAIGRISAEDFTSGWKTGTGRRMQAWKVDQYQFSTVFVDPPRAGLDAATLELVQHFDHILYMSCNPNTLHENLQYLTRTHQIDSLALFDQFPYTPHREVGVKLSRQ